MAHEAIIPTFHISLADSHYLEVRLEDAMNSIWDFAGHYPKATFRPQLMIFPEGYCED